MDVSPFPCSIYDRNHNQRRFVMAVSIHRKIIIEIDNKWHDGTPFAIWEVRNNVGVSTSSVTRTLKKLVDLRLLFYSSKGYVGRHYRVAARWINVDEVIENYEFAKILHI